MTSGWWTREDCREVWCAVCGAADVAEPGGRHCGTPVCFTLETAAIARGPRGADPEGVTS